MMLRSTVVACSLMCCQPLPAQIPSPAAIRSPAAIPSQLTDANSERKLEALLQKMTLDEKVGQLVQYSAGQATGPGTGRTDYNDMIARGQIGSLFNVIEQRSVNEYQHIAVEKSR